MKKDCMGVERDEERVNHIHNHERFSGEIFFLCSFTAIIENNDNWVNDVHWYSMNLKDYLGLNTKTFSNWKILLRIFRN